MQLYVNWESLHFEIFNENRNKKIWGAGFLDLHFKKFKNVKRYFERKVLALALYILKREFKNFIF